MTKNKEFKPFDIFKCDMCELEDGRPTLHWEDKDFNLCYECLDKLFMEHLMDNYKIDEKVVIKRPSISEEVREFVFSRDDRKCKRCGSTETLQIDHVVAFSLGGGTKIDNLQTLCRKCNLLKGKK